MYPYELDDLVSTVAQRVIDSLPRDGYTPCQLNDLTHEHLEAQGAEAIAPHVYHLVKDATRLELIRAEEVALGEPDSSDQDVLEYLEGLAYWLALSRCKRAVAHALDRRPETKKYSVIITETASYEVKVKATSEEEAITLAEDRFTGADDRDSLCIGITAREFTVTETQEDGA